MKIPTSFRVQLGEAAEYLLNEPWLITHYVEQQLSTREIAKLLGCGKKAVSTALKRFKIELRCHFTQRNLSQMRMRSKWIMSPIALDKLDNKDWLYNAYITENKSVKEIAQCCATSITNTRKWLRRHDIKKNSDQWLACSVRRYTELNGFHPGSDAACKKRMRGRNAIKITTNKGGEIWCHSKWEHIVANLLDKSDVVIAFSKDSLRLPYEFAGHKRCYYPDFMVALANKRYLIIEVKPAKLMKDERTIIKLETLAVYASMMGFDKLVVTGTNRVVVDELITYLAMVLI